MRVICVSGRWTNRRVWRGMAGGEVEWIVDWWGKAGRLNMVEGRERRMMEREGRWTFCERGGEGESGYPAFLRGLAHTHTHTLSLSLSGRRCLGRYGRGRRS